MVRVEIITIGDEILIGQIVDSNSAWMAQKLNNIGIEVYQITTVSDKKEHIVDAIDEAKTRVDIVLLTGGLGPTRDDLTKLTLSEYFNTKLVLNNEVLEHIEELLTKRDVRVNQLNRDQALLPENCKHIKNIHGTAAGMWFEESGKIFISMPGVPYEMKAMMENHILPALKEQFCSSYLIHKTLMIHNYAESELAEKIEDWENNLPSEVKLAYLPSPGRIRLRMSVRGDDKDYIDTLLEELTRKLTLIIPNDISSFDSEFIEQTVGRLLSKYEKTLSIAESCTGGMISQKISSVPGCSEYFLGCIVAYSNDIKTQKLGVKSDVLEKYGAVSEEVIIEMVESVREKMNSDYSVATSGIAGPGGGTIDKPVGTTWIAVSSAKRIVTKKYNLGDQRSRNIEKASTIALNMLREFIEEENK